MLETHNARIVTNYLNEQDAGMAQYAGPQDPRTESSRLFFMRIL